MIENIGINTKLPRLTNWIINYLAPLRRQRITKHIRCGLTPLPFRTLPSATSYMLIPLSDMQM
ncbi:MAG: hypothetical protein KAT65_09160, partial [Methanophagales archaeon]|nr:hypothetical protein [Methanophagales archaeon]